jgi:hypothetical protein
MTKAETRAFIEAAVAKALANGKSARASRTQKGVYVKKTGITSGKTRKAASVLDHLALLSDPNRAVEAAAASNTVANLPTPTREQVEKCGGGIYGFLRARRELERSGNE